MSQTTIGFIGFAALLFLLALRMPIGIAMMLVGTVGIAVLNSPDAALRILGEFPYAYSSVYALSVIPLFVLMGNFASASGLGRDLYGAAYAWIGHRRGGLASATILACAGFAALSGSSVASAATMGKVALPEMRRYRYDPRLATGAVAAGGTLGILIPPSTAMIVYALLTEQSIGKLFLAGFLPGLLLTALFVVTIAVVANLRPEMGPPGERQSIGRRFAALMRSGALLAIVVIVIGGIYLGMDDFSGLLRLVLLQHNGENFSTSEACALERIDAFDEVATGKQQILDEEQAREEYVDALLAAANLQTPWKLPHRLTLGVLDAGTEKAVRRLFEKLHLPVEIICRPLESDTAIRQSILSFERDLLSTQKHSSHFVLLLATLGESLRVLLPEKTAAPFGVSDVALAQILANHKPPNRNLLGGWLMPKISSIPVARAASAQIYGMNANMAAFAHAQGYKAWYGFDGNGGITVSEWSHYHDALMALTHLLPHLNEENYALCCHVGQCYSNAYHLLPCADEAKAQVVRKLIESFGGVPNEVNDGVKFELESGWVLVRLCAGREALEVFKHETKRAAYDAGKSEITVLLERILASFIGWIKEARAEKQE
ncbi:TRAP transporter large permease subunit [candidate division KSB1 bacterium]|nr:TRAP transporter large permease subunit [candidate division KSB1 bacterium]